jgi:molybdenum cofactor cytidylyltransferase
VAGVVLAAGESRRMGQGPPKQLLSFEGEPLVRRVARVALASSLDEVIVVVGHAAADVRQALAALSVRTVTNPDYAAGQSTSVKVGLENVAPTADAAMFIPVDQPLITPRFIDRLVSAYSRTRAAIVLPTHAGRRGAPVLLDRTLFLELAKITGDAGGRQILDRYTDRIVSVPLEDPAPLLDIDTPEAYDELLRRSRA